MFGNNVANERIYEQLKYIYENEYKNQWDDCEYQLKFTMDVMEVLYTLFGD